VAGQKWRKSGVVTALLYERFESWGLCEVTGEIPSAMRSEFGGHAERKQ